VLRITDNGRGMRPGVLDDESSLGVLGMRERAAILEGTLKISSWENHGTVVNLEIPLEEATK